MNFHVERIFLRGDDEIRSVTSQFAIDFVADVGCHRNHCGSYGYSQGDGDACQNFAPALMAGNTVVLKHASQTILVGERFDQAMKKAGAGTLKLNSGYRAYSTQLWIYKDRVARLGLKAGEALAARPGYSEHQTGLAADVSAVGQGCVIQVCFGSTKAGKWIAANAWQYGFIVRYPNGQTSTTGYQYEPWHLRYVGVEISTDMRAQRMKVLEMYWGLPPAPKY